MEVKNGTLHPQLQQDCHLLGEWPGCLLLLHKNAALHWFLLVPVTKEPDFLDLPASQQQEILSHATEISRLLKGTLNYPKVNLAAIGNVVPQLHLHVIGRRPDDACWPAPVWGNLAAGQTYSPDEVASLQQLFAEDPRFEASSLPR